MSVCSLDVFKMDPDFLENEEKYKTIRRGENDCKRHTRTVCLVQSNQSAVISWQQSWMRAAAIQERRETAATTKKTMKKRMRRREKVSVC